MRKRPWVCVLVGGGELGGWEGAGKLGGSRCAHPGRIARLSTENYGMYAVFQTPITKKQMVAYLKV